MSASASLFTRRSDAARSFIATTAGVLVFLTLWQVTAGLFLTGNGTVPTPFSIVRQFSLDGLSFYGDLALETLRAAILGWFWGNLAAVVLALVVTAIPALHRPVLQIGVASYCIPIVAIGPVLVIVLSGDVPKVVLAALSVFFTTLIGAIVGLRSVDATMLDVVHAFGGNGIAKLLKVRVRAALPSLFAAFRIAAPAAILGAIVAEYMGTENGLGVAIINAQQALEVSRTWAIAVVATAMAGVGYALTSLIARLLTPWSREVRIDLAAGLPRRRGRSRALHALSGLMGGAVSIALILFVWWATLKILDVPPFIGKGPLEVWAFLTDPAARSERWRMLAAESAILLRDASLGLVVGTIAAVLVAMMFNVWPAMQRAFLGLALALRAVPLVAMTPLVVLTFGRNLTAITVIGAIITFFPTLVNMTLALAQTPKESVDLVHVYGGSRLDRLLKVQIPSALPALFASLRTAAPLAMTGAMMAAWLATGQGLGYAIVTAGTVSDYTGLWTRVALVTTYSILLYQLMGWVERMVLARLSGV